MAFYLLRMPVSEVEKFARAMIDAKLNTKTCEICFNISSESPCEICTSPSRDKGIICVVAETKDLIAIEKTNEFEKTPTYKIKRFLYNKKQNNNKESHSISNSGKQGKKRKKKETTQI